MKASGNITSQITLLGIINLNANLLYKIPYGYSRKILQKLYWPQAQAEAS